MTRWLTPAEERAWRGYRRMRTVLDLAIARDLRQDSGLSDADYDVLSTLSEAEGDSWRAGDLAARLLWSTSRLAHQVGRMERRDLVASVRRHLVDLLTADEVVTLDRIATKVLEQTSLEGHEVRKARLSRAG